MERKTIAQIQSEGYDALTKALGPEDAIRFIRSLIPALAITLRIGRKISRTSR